MGGRDSEGSKVVLESPDIGESGAEETPGAGPEENAELNPEDNGEDEAAPGVGIGFVGELDWSVSVEDSPGAIMELEGWIGPFGDSDVEIWEDGLGVCEAPSSDKGKVAATDSGPWLCAGDELEGTWLSDDNVLGPNTGVLEVAVLGSELGIGPVADPGSAFEPLAGVG